MKKQISEIVDIEEQRQALINKLTNWQRHQWTKAGCPNKFDEIVRFTELKRGT